MSPIDERPGVTHLHRLLSPVQVHTGKAHPGRAHPGRLPLVAALTLLAAPLISTPAAAQGAPEAAAPSLCAEVITSFDQLAETPSAKQTQKLEADAARLSAISSSGQDAAACIRLFVANGQVAASEHAQCVSFIERQCKVEQQQALKTQLETSGKLACENLKLDLTSACFWTQKPDVRPPLSTRRKVGAGIAIGLGVLALSLGIAHIATPVFKTSGGCAAGGADNECAASRYGLGIPLILIGLTSAGLGGGLTLGLSR